MFPSTIWTTIRLAGEQEQDALEEFAQRYRAPILNYIQKRGFLGNDAEDLCQDVFVRVLQGRVLAKADRERGRFRSLLLAVTSRVIQHRLRKRTATPVEDLEPPDRLPEFDRPTGSA